MFFKCLPPDTDRVRVKICGLRDIKTAIWAVDQGIDAVGLVFYKASIRYATFEQARAIARAVNGQADIIGVFVNPSTEEVEQAIKAGITGLQFHGNEVENFCNQWQLPWIKAIHVDNEVNLASLIHQWQNAFACLLDTRLPGSYGGTGKRFDWSNIPEKNRSSVILSGGLNAGNVAEAIIRIKPLALDVSSGVESFRGEKSRQMITEFMQEVHNAQKNSTY